MKIIINSPTYGKKKLLIDNKDFKLISKYKWRIHKNQSNNYYAMSWTPMVKKKRKIIRIHNLITGFKFVDHINGDGLDNRRKNLRESNHSKNSMNRKKFLPNKTSQYKGVFKFKNKWYSRITLKGKTISLGIFDSELQAAITYNNAALEYFGEFASINILNRKV